MRLPDIYAANKFALSFELFPPKTEAGVEALFGHAQTLVGFKPAYITCTYGAGGSTQDRTLEIAARVRKEFGLPVATHLTCVGRTADQIRDYLRRAAEADVTNVVALRGDPPAGETEFRFTEGGFHYANELVAMIHEDFPAMGVAVGGYPEVHQEAPSPEADLDALKRKVDAGAHAIITQLFYDNEDFFRFRDRCNAAGIDVPLIPGLLPVTNVSQVKRIASLCGAGLPVAFLSQLEACGDDAAAQFDVGVEQATVQTQGLVDAGVPGIHYYVLNKSEAASRVLKAVRLGG
ncbi:5,10-methylenetetrahydrofolate reductase [Botrimarina colliarenosi]|uniref:Methylenetetrahydrofolate reductase n=1 Tax=Botrimarina colliarenosi TaxID=2528001 RepID=A0A5C6AI62_9BACT|nr:methylenetetrahydrofolate reductase [NAD(P)H] [Botrimarina colliarenosi]TWT99086.1 5,10-methylenetetrahydrofolate reductase [Botrimarina colliarenosi]